MYDPSAVLGVLLARNPRGPEVVAGGHVGCARPYSSDALGGYSDPKFDTVWADGLDFTVDPVS